MDVEEVWKDVIGYEGLYQVSSKGNVKRVEHEDCRCRQGYRIFKERMLKPHTNFRGYIKVTLWKDSKKKDVFVHRLVAKAFIKNPCDYPQVNHKDEDKTNNYVGNLEWCTNKYNTNYGEKHKQKLIENARRRAKRRWEKERG